MGHLSDDDVVIGGFGRVILKMMSWKSELKKLILQRWRCKGGDAKK
jgi:hypothetical protein